MTTPATAVSAPKRRRAVLDVARAAAIVLVLVIHCTENLYYRTPVPLEGGVWSFAVLHYLGRLGVPLFLFLTGTLVASKRFESVEDVVGFYRRSLVPLLVTTEIWCLIYIAFLYCRFGIFDLSHSVAYMLFLKQLPPQLPHWWYLPMIVGVYGAIPFVGLAVQKLPPKALVVPLAVVVAYVFCIPTYNQFAGAVDLRQLPTPVSIDLAFYGGIYGLYVVMGYLLDRRGVLRKVPSAVLVVAALLALLAGIYVDYLGVNTWYDSVFVLIDSIAVFELLLRLEERAPLDARPAVTLVSATSFGMYLVHELILIPVADLLPESVPIDLRVAMLFVAVFCLSLLVVWALRRIPVVGRLLFLK